MTTTQNEVRYEITGGPSREELFDSLRLGRIVDAVNFNVTNAGDASESAVTLELSVSSLEREDGSGFCWNFTAYVMKRSGAKVPSPFRIARGFYRTNARKGFAFLS